MAMTRYQVTPVNTRFGTMYSVDDTLLRENTIFQTRDKYEAELKAMVLNCESEEELQVIGC